jgi:hypothetical protein
MAEQDALQLHCPSYSTDSRETISPVDLEEYIRTQTRQAGAVTCTQSGLYLHYFTFYTADDGSLATPSVTWDNREYQLQHLVVELSTGGQVIGVLYRPHGKNEDYWVRGTDLKTLLSDGHPNVYIARSTHAQNAVSGTVMRRMGAIDKCDKPVLQTFTAQSASEDLMNLSSIDGILDGLRTRISEDFSHIPTVSLGSVRTRLHS